MINGARPKNRAPNLVVFALLPVLGFAAFAYISKQREQTHPASKRPVQNPSPLAPPPTRKSE
ncbi:hypothetical protein CALVIDRAFT_564489 [Calocera viscosa TUFC12733]|uniref:Uncharacterized protein n=1 Tax=Calocera viscosa (strain TUFC12733) TaxID=1330018 RepID=A0A167LLZ3_CALVF|nr:hypothetical protein CALVIDRAFT_564489 [Calocera viscosa TUFC12733]